MNRLVLAAACALVLTPVGASIAEEPAAKLDVKVLYAGAPDAPRTKEFVEFLARAFAKVGTIDAGTLSMDAAREFDVVIVDSPNGANSHDARKIGAIGRDFVKPTILMGAAGGDVLHHLDIKLDWL